MSAKYSQNPKVGSLIADGNESDSGFIASNLSNPTKPSQSADLAGNMLSNNTSSSTSHAVNNRMGPHQQPQQQQLDTLDEPVWDTIRRDLINIAMKLRQVLLPTSNSREILSDWDLWGPLLFCLSLASLLGLGKPADADNLFASVFVLVWCGAGVVTLNGQLLGGKLTFFQSICVLGYCLFPFVVGALACLFIAGWMKPLLLVCCLLWACRAATGFLAMDGFDRRRILAVYPICLFYFIIGWLILVSTTSKAL